MIGSKTRRNKKSRFGERLERFLYRQMITYEKRPAKKAKSGYTWRYKLTYKDEYGVTQNYSKSGFTTKKAAEQHAIQMQSEFEKGYTPEKQAITMADLWDEYCKVKLALLAPNTRESYTRIYQKHIYPALGKSKIKDLKYPNLQAYFNTISHLNKSMVQHIKSLLRVLFKYALQAGYIPYSPMNDIQISYNQGPKKRHEYITQDELNQIIQCLWNDIGTRGYKLSIIRKGSYSIAIYLGYYLGLRISEALAVSWDDIDFENHSIYIHAQLEAMRPSADQRITETLKTENSKDTLFIPDPLYRILLEWREYNKSDYLCVDENGSLIAAQTLIAIIRAIKKKLGMDIHFHALRHTFATNMVKITDPKTASKLARHATTALTLNIYTEVLEQEKKEALKKAFSQEEKK